MRPNVDIVNDGDDFQYDDGGPSYYWSIQYPDDYGIHFLDSHLTNKVRNKGTNELMHGRNIRFGQDLNQGRLVEKPIPSPQS